MKLQAIYLRGRHLDFIVTNLDEMLTRLCGLGATLDREIQIHEYGRMANMADPLGSGFDPMEYDDVRGFGRVV